MAESGVWTSFEQKNERVSVLFLYGCSDRTHQYSGDVAGAFAHPSSMDGTRGILRCISVCSDSKSPNEPRETRSLLPNGTCQ